MIGLKLTKDNCTFFASVEKGSIGVIISRMILDIRNCISVNFGGYDMQTETYPHWCLQKLFLGDKLTIKVEEITEENSPFIERDPEIENHFFDHPKNIGIELNLKDEKLSAVVEKGSIHLITTVLNSEEKTEIDLDFLASNYSDNGKETKYWYKKTLQLGDEITIEIKEIEKITLPIQV